MTLQVTLCQLDDYGPWTTTPEPRPEMTLQALQSRLYADLADRVGERDGYVFRAREDNLVAVTNGLDRAAHEALQAAVAERYPVTLSLAVGTAETPVAALDAATRRLQASGSAQDEGRREVLVGDLLPEERRTGEDVHVAHFDVVDATGRLTDTVGAADALLAVDEVAGELRRHLHRRHDALAFFVGGDNVVAVTPALDRGAYRDACQVVADRTGLDLQVGVGSGATARAAGMAAKHRLETCRERGRRVVAGDSPAAGTGPVGRRQTDGL